MRTKSRPEETSAKPFSRASNRTSTSSPLAHPTFLAFEPSRPNRTWGISFRKMVSRSWLNPSRGMTNSLPDCRSVSRRNFCSSSKMFRGWGASGTAMDGTEGAVHLEQERFREADPMHQLSFGEETRRRAGIDHLPFLHHLHLVRPGVGALHVMGGHDDRQTLMVQFVCQFEELVHHPRVQPSRWLVHDKYLWAHGDGPSQRDPLPLSEGELLGRLGALVQQTHLVQRFRHPRLYLVHGETEVHGAEGHVLLHSGREDLVVWILKDYGHLGPKLLQRLRSVLDLLPLEEDLPLSGL